MKRDEAGNDSGAFVSKLTVEAKMDELEALGIKPVVQVVREALGGTTAVIGEQVKAVNQERDAEVERAIYEDLLTVSKKLLGKARESAKRLYANEITSLTDEVVRIQCERDQQSNKVAQLTAQHQEAQVRCEAAEQLLAREVAAHEQFKRDLAATKESLIAARLEQEHTSSELAHAQGQVISAQRDRQASEANERQLQRQLDMSVENLQAERVARLSAQELLEGERAAHRVAQASLAESQETLAVVRTEQGHLLVENASLKEEVAMLSEALGAEQQKVQLGQERADALKRTLGGMSAQHELLIERVRTFSDTIANEFELVWKRGRA